MSAVPETRRRLRFACTSCGACCNRSPEVELHEAAALADVFVFRLMFRLYQLPRTLAGYLQPRTPTTGSGDEFYESKRLLAAFADRKWATKRRIEGKAVDYTNYLTISALTVDAGTGACAALSERRCGIYERRPLACRTVPFHYSRPEALAERDLKAFVATPGYDCDTGPGAPVVLEAGRIVDLQSRRMRSEALDLAGHDRRWGEAIVRRLKRGDYPLPSLSEIEANAPFGAMTTSMRVAWQIAAEAGLIDAERCKKLIAAQAAVIDRALGSAEVASSAGETLRQMRAEYQALLT